MATDSLVTVPAITGQAGVEYATVNNQQDSQTDAPQQPTACAVGHSHIALSIALLLFLAIALNWHSATILVAFLRYQPPLPLRRPPIAALFV